MTDEEAATVLSNQRCRDVAVVLHAMDHLQRRVWEENMEQDIRRDHPHSESDMMRNGSEGLEKFILASFPGNGVGLKMFTSAFVTALRLLHMEEQAGVVLATSQQLDNE